MPRSRKTGLSRTSATLSVATARRTGASNASKFRVPLDDTGRASGSAASDRLHRRCAARRVSAATSDVLAIASCSRASGACRRLLSFSARRRPGRLPRRLGGRPHPTTSVPSHAIRSQDPFAPRRDALAPLGLTPRSGGTSTGNSGVSPPAADHGLWVRRATSGGRRGSRGYGREPEGTHRTLG